MTATELRNKRGGEASARVQGGHSTRSFYKYYRANKGKLTRDTYYKVIREVNESFVEEMMEDAEDFLLPAGMGKISFRKKKNEAYMHEGKLKTTASINWKGTMELWEKDFRAKANKILIRYKNMSTGRYSFRIQMLGRRFKNNEYFSFWYKRSFKRKFAARVRSYNKPKIEVEKIKDKRNGF